MASTKHMDVNHLFNMRGHICVVTGGGTGIGLMASQALSANGAKVYITGRRTEVLQNAAETHTPDGSGGQIIPLGPCDVTKKDDLQRLVKDLQCKEKYINLLICNAGVAGQKQSPTRMTQTI